MTSRDELAALEAHKQDIAESITDIKRGGSGTCGLPHEKLAKGVAALLAVELWKLDHPIVARPFSKTIAAVSGAFGAGAVVAVAKIFGLKLD